MTGRLEGGSSAALILVSFDMMEGSITMRHDARRCESCTLLGFGKKVLCVGCTPPDRRGSCNLCNGGAEGTLTRTDAHRWW